MDIRILNPASSGRSSTTEASALLQRLQAAGSIEAEVVRVLADKLLLRTELGEILTRNTLRYQAGDRIKLRLDATAETPVLKVSEIKPRPLSLQSARYPELARLLPANRPVLAAVLKILAEATLLRIAGQEMSLPRRIDTAPGQLLSFVRRPQLKAIEVDKVSAKSIYRALLRQLLPQTTDQRSSALVKLFELVSAASGSTTNATSLVAPVNAREVKPRSAPPTPSSTPSPPTGTIKLSSQPVPAVVVASLAALPGLKPQTEFPGGSGFANPQSARPAMTRQLPPNPAFPARLLATRDPTRDPVSIDKQRQTAGSLLQSRRLDGSLDQPAQLLPRPATQVQQGGVTLSGGSLRTAFAGTDQPMAMPVTHNQHRSLQESPRATAQPGPTTSAELPGSRFAPPDAIVGRRNSALSPANTVLSISMPVGGGATTSPPPGSVLLAQLQALPGMEKIDALELKRWFELLGFVRPAAGGKATPQARELLRLLQPLATPNDFARDLLRATTPTGKTSADSEPAAARASAQETLLPLLRDGIRLLEQALAQNLLQRATLGMQQESQQPMTLAFALPYLEGERVKPLQIELEQRNQASAEDSRSWEIRLSFELADQGPVNCHVILEGHTVSASFYCALEQTRERFEQALPELQNRLFDVGLVAGEMRSFLGIPLRSKSTPMFTPGDSLIDIEV